MDAKTKLPLPHGACAVVKRRTIHRLAVLQQPLPIRMRHRLSGFDAIEQFQFPRHSSTFETAAFAVTPGRRPTLPESALTTSIGASNATDTSETFRLG